MSHDPGERNHGAIDEALDREFLAAMSAGDVERASRGGQPGSLAAAGAGTIELLAWVRARGGAWTFPRRGRRIRTRQGRGPPAWDSMWLEEHGS